MYSEIVRLSRRLLKINDRPYKRYAMYNIGFKNKFSILLGPRGVGKTTVLVQYLLEQAGGDLYSQKILYVQADHFIMKDLSLYEIAEEFEQAGGQIIVFDEIHKYDNWAQELKSIYDTFPALKIIASGSSVLEISKDSYDLSRRAVVYRMHGLSLREYLELEFGLKLPVATLQELITNHEKLVVDILRIIEEKEGKILPSFADYLVHGYYPFYYDYKDSQHYLTILEQNVHTTIEADLPAVYSYLTGASIKRIERLLAYIAGAVPFVPRWEELKRILEIKDSRTLKVYLGYLEDAGIIRTITKSSDKLRIVENPGKIYLDNPNLLSALASQQHNSGTARELFFLDMICGSGEGVTLPLLGDFLVAHKYTFEVGGKKKGFSQLKGVNDAYLVCDEIEQGVGRKIPLWLFGFLY